MAVVHKQSNAAEKRTWTGFHMSHDEYLTVRLLAACTSTLSAKLLGLAATGVSDQKRTVVRDEELTQLEG